MRELTGGNNSEAGEGYGVQAPDTLFLIGTGLSKAISPKIPLNNELLPELIGRETSLQLKKFSAQYKASDIETLLTQIDIEKDPKLRHVRKKINEEIAQYFSGFAFSSIPSTSLMWLEQLANDVLRPNDAVVSLNYDCLFEGVLDHFRVWTPNGGYSRHLENPLVSSRIAKNPRGIKLYKIHGSVNFKEDPVLGTQDQTGIGILINEGFFPVSGKFRDFGYGGLSATTYIIAPSFVKIPHYEIMRMMLEVLEIVEDASTLVIIGCSLRPEDSFLRLLITCFYKEVDTRRKRIIIVDPNAAAVRNSMNEFWIGELEDFLETTLITNRLESSLAELVELLHPSS